MLSGARIKHTSWNSEVYEPSDDSFLLVDALLEHAPKWRLQPPRCCVELGSGSGYVICSLALMLQQLGIRCQLLAIDHSTAAAKATTQTLRNHEVSNVDVVTADMFTPAHRNLLGSVDVLVFNPPYVPTPDEELLLPGVATAWAGGHMGRRVIDRLLGQLDALLSPAGELFMVTVTENRPEGEE
ncbi:MAG: hypothetical protein WDW38_003982 [Sanguina aurantia]